MISTCVRRQLLRRGQSHPKPGATMTSVRSLSTPAAMPQRAPKPIVTPNVGAVVSRRQWNKLYKPPPRQPPPKDSTDDKPWPRSIQMLGYAAATTLVPYCIAWFIASNQTVRNALFPRVPGMESFLRSWFGHPEDDFYSYVDYRQQQEGATKLDVPLTLDHELPFKTRKEQAEVETLIHKYQVPARIRVFTHGGFNLGEVLQLPGDIPVTSTTLLHHLMSDRERTIDPESVAYVTVDFQNVNEENNHETSETTSGGAIENDTVLSVHIPSEEQSSGDSLLVDSSPNNNNNNNNNSSRLALHIRELAKTTSIYSKWHYHVSPQPASSDQKQQNASRKLSMHEMKVAELEYKMEQLQAQLKDNTATKSFDDLMDEIKQTKSELRRLKWKKRLGMAA